MRVKTSVSLSSDVLEKVQTMTSEGNRSEFIEKALWSYMDMLQRDARNKNDLEILNDSADRLNYEAQDSLEFQKEI